MLRSIGSSLVAKSSPGGKLRELGEQAITTPQVPGKGAIGSISRAGLEEPMKREVPAGSEKIVGVQPIVESQAGLPADVIPSEVMPPAPIPEGMNPFVSANVPSGSRGQALFQGGVGGSSGGAAAGAPRQATKQVSSGFNTVGEALQPKVTGGQSTQNVPTQSSQQQGAPFSDMPGGKVFAGDKGANRQPAKNIPQALGFNVPNKIPVYSNVTGLINKSVNAARNVGGAVVAAGKTAANLSPAAQILRSVQNFFSRLRSGGGKSW